MSNPNKQTPIPKMIALRTGWLTPIIKAWRKENPYADWAEFNHVAIKESATMKRLAGKANKHILESL